MDEFPKWLKFDKWFTEEKDLPDKPTDDIFLVKAIDVKTEKVIYTLATFLYWPNREPIDYDEWRFICGATCYARYSSENLYNVVAWTKVNLEF